MPIPVQRAPVRPTRVAQDSHVLQTIADALKHAEKIVVIAGAGISTGAGIKDFRSPGGLYAGGELFYESAFVDSRKTKLLQTALQLRELAAHCEPTETHRWLASLDSKLRRCYTQNIDMLEGRAGLKTGIGGRFRCIPLHGSLADLQCNLCRETYRWETYRDSVKAGRELRCPRCTARSDARETAGRRRLPIGQLRPSIVMLDAVHPQGDDIASLVKRDCAAKTDVLVILGTSLKVDGPRALTRQFARRIRAQGGIVVYVNRSKPAAMWNGIIHYWVHWECDEWVRDLLRRHRACSPGFTKEHPIVID